MIRSVLATVMLSIALVAGQPASNPTTFCNPLNLNYPFVYSQSHRETGEPTPVLYKGDYYLFASYLDGYWWSHSLSNDFSTWTFVPHTTQTIPLMHTGMHLCPWEYNGYIYIDANEAPNIYRSNDPKSGAAWELVTTTNFQWDPSVCKGFDGNYYMSAVHDRISRLDPAGPWTYSDANSGWFSGVNFAEYGWQVEPHNPTGGWQEGSNLTTHRGRYFFEWSTPNTSVDEYCEGMKVLDSSYAEGSPLGKPGVELNGWKMQAANPFSFKPTGFIAGAGHGQIFEDVDGSIWKFSTMNLSARNAGWERLLGMTAAYIDENKEIYCDHVFGDWPQYIPGKRPGGLPARMGDNFSGWMLLSYNKPATASSSLATSVFGNTLGIDKAFDETIKTWWSATTSNAGEWLRVDLKKSCTIRGIQTAFAEEGITNTVASELYHAYKIEISQDDQNWTTLIDKSANRKDVPYDYAELAQPATARYVKITNVHMSGLGKFALSGFRIFGNADSAKPAVVDKATINRASGDRKVCTISWPRSAGAMGYSVRFGVAPDKLYLEYQVLNGKNVDYPAGWIKYSIQDTALTINSLNATPTYYFRVDAFNESGITQGTKIVNDLNVVYTGTSIQGITLPAINRSLLTMRIINGKVAVTNIPLLQTAPVNIRLFNAQGVCIQNSLVQPNRGSAFINISQIGTQVLFAKVQADHTTYFTQIKIGR